MADEVVAIGLRARTGAAEVVVLARGPRLVTRARLELAPPDAAFCYHAAAELPLARAERHLRAAFDDAVARAHAALAPIVAGLARPRAGLVRGKPRPRPLPPLADVLKVHALWHAAEGEHYRDALAAACARLDVPVLAIPAPELAAATGLGDAARAPRSPRSARPPARRGRPKTRKPRWRRWSRSPPRLLAVAESAQNAVVPFGVPRPVGPS